MKITGRNYPREKIRERDGHTCQICGKIWIRGARKFDVHHKDCQRKKTQQYDKLNKEKNNLITLCHKCHLNLPEHLKAIKVGQKLSRKRIKKIMKDKKIYSINELIKLDWFPIKSYTTFMNLFNQGRISAIDVNTSPEPKIRRLKVTYEEAVRYASNYLKYEKKPRHHSAK